MFKNVVTTCIILSCFLSCTELSRDKAFLDKYEYADFSQFKNVSVYIRGIDNTGNEIVMINAPNWINDTAKVGLYVVAIEKKQTDNKYGMDIDR